MGNKEILAPTPQFSFLIELNYNFSFIVMMRSSARCVMWVECNCANIDKSIMTLKHYIMCFLFEFLIKSTHFAFIDGFTVIMSQCDSV